MSAEGRDIARTYKRAVASRYRALKAEELSQIPSGPAWVSPKIDGELWLVVLDGGKASLIAPGNRTLENAPVLAELHAAASRAEGKIVLAGELFAAGAKGQRPRVGDVAAALAEGDAGRGRLGWHGFDVVEIDGAPAPALYEERLALLQKLLEGGKRAAAVKTILAKEPADIEQCWNDWAGSGKAEGLVVRVQDGRIFKVKPGFNLDAVVVGYTPKADIPEQVRSLLVALIRSDGSFQLVSGVGNVGGEDMRHQLYASLSALECESRFRHASGDGSLVRWVVPKVVVELACTDVQATDTAGEQIVRWTLRHGADGWNPLAPMPCVSLLNPVLARIRDDKQANDVDVRMAQVAERCYLDSSAVTSAPMTMPRSLVTRREVWTKEAKGKVAVRKLLVWKTNKESAGPDWPAWVVSFIDYSPDRKMPLERTVRTAVSESAAKEIADALVAENIKKGWEAVPVVPGKGE
jgi:ATP-dependent DNA ligase